MTAHLDLDGAWGPAAIAGEYRDVQHWGPRLRYCAPASEVEAFDRHCGDLPRFILYGSGDYHYLAGLWVRRATRRLAGGESLRLISFDNHPDWDIRPPRWACGGWLCRALELPAVSSAHVWGCGNFELNFPARLTANWRAIRAGRLAVHGWSERFSPAVSRQFGCVTRDNWRERFGTFADGLAGEAVYITVDIDCLADGESITNWESGLFSADDVAWAIGRLRATASQVIGGDVCGACSPPLYARWRQRLAAKWDRPRLPTPDPNRARQVNQAALQRIWPVLTGQPA